uniref:PX domain containing 1a n=1 Tax=Sinocyclocheilus grahami TaxID=75366 RepID=A0A672PCQ2_SINGR
SVMAGVYMETFPQLSVNDCWVFGLERFSDSRLGLNVTFEISGHLTDKRFHYSMYVLSALQRIKEAEQNNNVQTRLDEGEKLLRILTFFKTSPFDYTLKTMYEPIQLLYQSPVTVADVRSANGFCLANTETVLFDVYLQAQGAEPSLKYSNMTYRHLQACETDILE